MTVEHAHKALLPPCDEAEHDAPIVHRLIGARTTPACKCVHTHRADVVAGWAEGNRSLTPARASSRASVPHSPPWRRVARLPSNSPCFFLYISHTHTLPIYIHINMCVYIYIYVEHTHNNPFLARVLFLCLSLSRLYTYIYIERERERASEREREREL